MFYTIYTFIIHSSNVIPVTKEVYSREQIKVRNSQVLLASELRTQNKLEHNVKKTSHN